MTQDEIIEMAKQARLTVTYIGEPIGLSYAQIAHFAKLVAEKEREACALLCYEQRKNWDALACADAIRAGTRPRGQA